jgi:SAM-dependent methyltransferase
MNRADWRAEKRRRSEVRMDTLFAPTYDAGWGHINETHRAMLGRFLDLCPPACTILDAAFGTGKYWPLILASGRAVQGIDQSAGMLEQARRKFPDVPTRKMGLQELDDTATVDGLICMDAMEFVFREDWPHVLGNFRRALAPRGHLYFTGEIAPAEEIAAAYRAGCEMGLPVVEGELAHEDGYHYYPAIEQVRLWTAEAHFDLLAEAVGDDYHHFLTRTA